MNYKILKDIIVKYFKIILIIIVILFLLIIAIIVFKKYTVKDNVVEMDPIIKNDTTNEKEEVKSVKITFDIKGAVKKPGVYTIEDDKRIIDAINLAGGLLDSADNSVINLSKKLKDEMVIIVYTKDEIKKMLQGNTSIKVIEKECICPKLENDACIEDNKVTNSNEIKNEISYPISINDASIEELMNLPNIGESKAKAIINFREENGNFEKIEDIMDVSGIGEKLFEQIKDFITI